MRALLLSWVYNLNLLIIIKSKGLYNSISLGSIKVVLMEFKKVTISLPKNLYDESMHVVKGGLFSNFSDLVRTGIREELKELRQLIHDFDERFVYNDKKLISGVKQSIKEARVGKGKILKSDKEMDKYFKSL